jgi:predicted ATPase/class 3 adenylate cyclase
MTDTTMVMTLTISRRTSFTGVMDPCDNPHPHPPRLCRWSRTMPDLPRGTVTFLFTDIEGSTALWERDRAAMREAVDRQLAILQSLIAAHHGVLFKTVGDGTQAAFGTAEEALRAAVASQRALLAEDGGELGPLRVRMALHAGEAIPDTHGDYLAAPLNRLARLLSTGYGGQILLSQTVQQLTRGALPAGSELRDLGEHRLRDLLEPERVYQLVHPDLPAAFPPLKSLEHRPNNLPRQPTPFLGREREVGEVVDLLRTDNVQLLTLIGPGGTGKTRLALQAAAESLDDFAAGVYFVPLASLSDPELVLPTMATTLGIREEGGQPLQERLQEYLATKQLLLVLDNVEHLVAAAPQVGDLLSTAPGLTVLVTSRVPLRLRAEREYAVSPLGLPRRKPPPTLEQLSQFEAVRLFIERAQAVKADFAIDNATAPTVAEICWRLDGLPLAIELAAARIRMLPPQAMLSRLEHRLPMLTGGARDAPERQRTLRNTIAWSYDLLQPDDQTLFRRLAMFAGGATFEAIEAVANPDGSLDVFGGLERLLEQSLLRQVEGLEGEPRFSMLETIREFGLEQLDAKREVVEAQGRHAAFFLALAEEAKPKLRGPEQGGWLARLDVEHDNLRTTLGWTLEHEPGVALRLGAALAWFWIHRGQLAEGRSWLERALAVCPDPTPTRVEALHGAGGLAGYMGDYAQDIAWQEASLTLARDLHDRSGEAWALLELGVIALYDADAAKRLGQSGESLTEASLRAFRELDDPMGAAAALNNLGYYAYTHGDLARADAQLTEALPLARAAGERLLLGMVLDSLGAVAQARNDLEAAVTLYREALVLAYESGTWPTLWLALRALASVAAAWGRSETAARLWGAADRLGEVPNSTPPPEELARHQHAIATARAQLGEGPFAAAWEAGRVQSLEEAVAEALAVADEVTRDGIAERH